MFGDCALGSALADALDFVVGSVVAGWGEDGPVAVGFL